MNTKPLRRSFYVHALLTAMAIGGIGAGCGEAEPLSEKSSALGACWGGLRYTTSIFGTKMGAPDGYRCPGGNAKPVTFITGYADSERVYGIELKWDTSGTKMYGVTNGLDPQLLDVTDDPVDAIKICLDSEGVLSGIRFKTVSGAAPGPLTLGHWCGTESQIAFDNIDDVLGDMQTWHIVHIMGVRFVYTGLPQ